MTEARTLRDAIVPFGNCVGSGENPSAVPDVFADIDSGRTVEPAAFQAALRACATCVQLKEYCKPNRDQLAQALYIGGVGLIVSGGEQVRVEAPTETTNELALRFDLTRIPDDPPLALNILRQGMRAGQLRMDGKKSKGAQTVASEYIDRLARANPELYNEITSKLGDEAQTGAEYIVTAIFQQRDFADFSAGVRTGNGAPNRYNPASYEPATGDPIVTRFLEETIAIQRLGLSQPANKATRFPSAYYQLLRDKYKTSAVSDSTFDEVISQNRRHPLGALRKLHARLHHAREQEPDAPQTYLHTTARLNRRADFSQRVAELSDTFAGVPHVTKGVIREAITHNGSAPEQAIINYISRVKAGIEIYGENHPIVRMAEITMIAKNMHNPERYLATLAKFRSNVIALIDRYSEPPEPTQDTATEPEERIDDPEVFSRRLASVHEDFSEGTIRRFSRGHLEGALDAAESFTLRLAKLREQSDGTIVDSRLRQITAQTSEPLTFLEVKNRVAILQISDKYRARLKNRDGKVPEGSTIKRIVSLYPEDEAGAVADNVYTLLNEGILVPALSEMSEVHDDNWHTSLDKIFDPAKGRYVTFNAALRQLSSEERITLAHRYNLMPLLYGADANSLVLEQSKLGGFSVKEHWQSTLAAQCASLVQAAEGEGEQPLDTHLLNQDLLVFNGMLNEKKAATPRSEITLHIGSLTNATVVVGERVLQLTNQNTSNKAGGSTEGTMGQWIEFQVATKYPEDDQVQSEALDYVLAAIKNGVIEVIGSSPTEYRFVFSKALYAETTSDLDRAVIAHETGLDYLLYGSNLGLILADRLGTEPRTVYIQRGNTPRVTDITDDIPPAVAQEVEAVAKAAELTDKSHLDAQVAGDITDIIVSAEKHAVTPFERQHPALFKILAKVFGEEAASITMTEQRVAKLLTVLRDTFEANLRRMGIPDEQRQSLGLAWQTLLNQDMEDSLERFGIKSEEVEPLVGDGMNLIGDLLANTPGAKVGILRRTLLAMPRDPTVRTKEIEREIVPIPVRVTLGTSAQEILDARKQRKAAMAKAASGGDPEEVTLARVVLKTIERGEQSFDIHGGNCESIDPDEMFGDAAAQNDVKERICGSCVLKIACRGDALANGVKFGVWGGMTERERRAWLRSRSDIKVWAGKVISSYEAEQPAAPNDTPAQTYTDTASAKQYTQRTFRA